MKVKELRELLRGIDDDRIVILQKDPEGNGYSPLHGGDDNALWPSGTVYTDHVGFEKLTPEMETKGYTKEDLGEGQPAFVMWPLQ